MSSPTCTGEAIELEGFRFAAFGGEVVIEASGPGARKLLGEAADRVLEVSKRLTRFDPTSELSRVNADPRATVEAGPMMIRFVEAAISAAEMTEGLVVPTLLPELEEAGYTRSMSDGARGSSISTPQPAAEESGPGSGLPISMRWKTLDVDPEKMTVTRQPGVRLDAGGIGKGMAADLVAELMEESDVAAWSVDCLGDVRVGGTAGQSRPVRIASPVPGQSPIEILQLRRAGIATSGTTKRSWHDGSGVEAHHLIDPRTGRPATSDAVQVTALGPTTVEAEARAKAALLSGVAGAGRWLPHGGIVVDRSDRVHSFEPIDGVA